MKENEKKKINSQNKLKIKKLNDVDIRAVNYQIAKSLPLSDVYVT